MGEPLAAMEREDAFELPLDDSKDKTPQTSTRDLIFGLTAHIRVALPVATGKPASTRYGG